MKTEPKKPENIGVINPYALAEVTLHRKINWKRVVEPQKLLEKTLGFEHSKLFDPKFGSPLYPGLTYKPEAKALVRAETPAVAGKPALLAKPVVEVGGTTVWVDPGDFFEEATEFSDPVQGALGDCYFIAALSSVAWARTYVIAQRTRATAVGTNDFVDMVEFYKAGKPEKVEVTEKIPLISPNNTFIYARSSEKGEIWPAVYEKAYAKWRTGVTTDTPDYAPIAGGDPVGAAAQLTGLTPYYFGNASMTADAIWQKVRENSVSAKTFNPMVAWTYPSGDASPDKVNYSTAHLVANHAYSILGWQFVNNQKYVVLRNPWGTYEATLNVDGTTWVAFDAPYYGGPGWWRPIAMPTVDGVFAIRADTFKSYFAGFGLVK